MSDKRARKPEDLSPFIGVDHGLDVQVVLPDHSKTGDIKERRTKLWP